MAPTLGVIHPDDHAQPHRERPMILHVIPGLGTGGAEHALASLVTAKRANAPEQAVVDLIGGGDLAPAIRAAGVPVFELNMTNPTMAPIAFIRLRSLIRRLRPTAIQSWLYYADLMALWALNLSGLRASTRLYWGVRCSNMDQEKLSLILRWSIATCASHSNQPDGVVANSYSGREFHRQLGYTPRAFTVISNGVDTDHFRPDATARQRIRQQLKVSDNKTVVIHVARMDPMKDHGSLLKVAAALPNMHFISVGLGTEHLRSSPNLLALGKRKDVAALYAASDLALSTSAYGEGFPNVIAEAMACGVPVVTTNVGDAAHLVGDSGIVVKPRDTEAMTAALLRLSSETAPDYLRRAEACRRRIKGAFSLEECIDAFDALHLHGEIPSE